MKSEQGLGLPNPRLPGEGGTRSPQNTLVSTGPGVDREAGSWLAWPAGPRCVCQAGRDCQ